MINHRKNRILLPALSAALLSLSTHSHAIGSVLVTNGNDAGEGSLRDALEVQEASQINISPEVTSINLLSTLTYDQTTALRIQGSGQTLLALGNFTILELSQGANLSASNLSLEGPGGFNINQRGDIGQDAGKGIFIDVRDNQTGTVELELNHVSVSSVANHGIHVSDCSLADDCGAGSGGAGNGSDASVLVTLNHVTIYDVGNGKFDADGLRVDDRGSGSIYLKANHLTANYVGADGVELDEGDEGGVYASVRHSDLSFNGNYCDPNILESFLPEQDEGEFEESEQVTETDIPGPIVGTPDDSCFEREVDLYDSGFVEEYAFAIDLDDGIDFDEAGEGAIKATFVHSSINYNLDEGVDLDEADDGNITARYVQTEALGNNDDGFKLTEEDDGDVIGTVIGVTAADNGGKGLVYEEEDNGNLSLFVTNTVTTNNDDSDDTGIETVQEDDGEGTLIIKNSTIADGTDLQGVDQI